MNDRLMCLHRQLTEPTRDVIFVGEEAWSWTRFSARVQVWVQLWQSLPRAAWALYEQRTDEFAAALLAAWYAGQTVYIPNDALPTTIHHLNQWVSGFVGDFPADARTPDKPDVRFVSAPPKSNQMLVFSQPAPLSSDSQVFFLTSGSTGFPKPIGKTLAQLCAEVQVLEAAFGDLVNGAVFYATVSHQHFFGFIFRFLWPVLYGRVASVEAIRFPEQLLSETPCRGRDAVLISSPAFLSRVYDLGDWSRMPLSLRCVFSAGGVLAQEDNRRIRSLWLAEMVEIYGSTETGAVGCKMNADARGFKPLPQVRAQTNTDGLLQLQAPHLDEPNAWYLSTDRAQVNELGEFELLGRSDRIIKLEEKRISLTQMEALLMQTGWCAQVHVVPFEQQSRTWLGVVMVLSKAGLELLSHQQRLGLINRFKQHLRLSFESLAIPRRWRFVSHIARNEQDKVAYQSLLTILESKPVVDQAVIHILKRTEHEIELQLDIPHELVYFQGHFPNEPILPGVVQIDWAACMSQTYFGLIGDFVGLKQLKFTQVIRPGQTVRLTLRHDAQRQSTHFVYQSELGGHASGIIAWGNHV